MTSQDTTKDILPENQAEGQIQSPAQDGAVETHAQEAPECAEKEEEKNEERIEDPPQNSSLPKKTVRTAKNRIRPKLRKRKKNANKKTIGNYPLKNSYQNSEHFWKSPYST